MPESESLESFVGGVARQSWDVFRRDALVWVLSGALAALLMTLTLGVIAGPLLVGLIEMVRRGQRQEPLQVFDVFNGFDKFGASFLALVLIAIGVAVGSCLLVLPGLLFALFSAYTLQVIAFEGSGAIDAIKRSFSVVRQHFLYTLVLLLILSVLQSIGSSVVLGVLITFPLGLIALTLGYQRLAAQLPAPPATPPGVLAE